MVVWCGSVRSKCPIGLVVVIGGPYDWTCDLSWFTHGKSMAIAQWLETSWCWERLKAGGEGDDRGWDGWMVSLTQWTWVWVTSGSGDGQGGLAWCSPWGRKESDTTERLNSNWYLEWMWLWEGLKTSGSIHLLLCKLETINSEALNNEEAPSTILAMWYILSPVNADLTAFLEVSGKLD